MRDTYRKRREERNMSVSEHEQQQQVQEILADVIWVVEPLLTSSECRGLIQAATGSGILTSIGSGDRRHRNCNTHYFRDEDLSGRIWKRLQQHVPTTIEFLQQHIHEPPAGFETENIKGLLGRWTGCGTNPHFTLLYYGPGGHFGPHRDSHKVFSEHQRSLLTVSIYLTARPSGTGGATQFLQDEIDLQCTDETGRIQAPEGSVRTTVEGDSAGKGVVFWHGLMHQGQALGDDSFEPKWLLVTQVLFERDPASAPPLINDERLAREYLNQAEQAEVNGNITEAIRLYNKAYRLDPRLEDPDSL